MIKEYKMKRKIITINEERCNGCGLCAEACHEGAIEMIDGVARLTREDFCDGLGDCLPTCPVGAISFEVREAPAYDEAAVEREKKAKNSTRPGCNGTCPGTKACTLPDRADSLSGAGCQADRCGAQALRTRSRLAQWPCQIKLVPPNAPYLDRANLLIAADCTAYAYASLHEDFMRGRITLIGCPKLDSIDYTHKLTDILTANEVMSLTVVRMEVPCCGGLESGVRRAIAASGRRIPWQVITISTDGKIVD